MARRGKTPVRGIRIDDETWKAAQAAADARNEELPDVIRAFLKRYAKTAPKTAGEEGR
jgi:antitoxin component of RelBE/YafQ-DinJ toxin-antitoxin module